MQVLDLFSGIGGFSLGLERAGFQTVAFCEIDKKCHKVLNRHWPEVPIFENVCTLTKELLDERGITVDVICGGFPCQDISFAGKGAGLDGERSGLWFEFHRLIEEIHPQYAIIENVSALRSRGLDAVLRSLAEIGYDAEWHCIPASAVGAPHRRDRIWIVAYPANKGSDRRIGEQTNDAEQNQQGRNFSGRGISNDLFETLGYPNLHGSSATFSEQIIQGIFRGPQKSFEQFEGSNISNVADTTSLRPSGSGLHGRSIDSKKNQNWETNWFVHSGQGTSGVWDVEPNVGRVVDGVPNRMDRLKQLGNAIVPQIPELIGRAILCPSP